MVPLCSLTTADWVVGSDLMWTPVRIPVEQQGGRLDIPAALALSRADRGRFSIWLGMLWNRVMPLMRVFMKHRARAHRH